MLSRCRNNMIAAVLLISSLLLGFVQAGGTEDNAVTNLKLGNQTIERVSIAYIWILIGWLGWRQHIITAFLAFSAFCAWTESILFFFFQTLQLRTHSLYAPYIDQDLQNRCAILRTFWWFLILTDHSLDGGILVPMPTLFVRPSFLVNPNLTISAPIRTQTNTSVWRGTLHHRWYRPLFLMFASFHSSSTGMAMVTSRIHSFKFCYRSRIQSKGLQAYPSFKSPDVIHI